MRTRKRFSLADNVGRKKACMKSRNVLRKVD